MRPRQTQSYEGPPTFNEEKDLLARGYGLIAGIDEVGRGSLAGPVAAAAVILPPRIKSPWLSQVRDSKQLTPKQRQLLAPKIMEEALSFGVGMVSSDEIDKRGIVRATRKAMGLAVKQLDPAPDYLLIDAVALPALKLPQKHMIKGDCLCISISCASIVAKVARDKLMTEYGRKYPGYGFGSHKGYGTEEHVAALQRLGACGIHRRSFEPVRAVCNPDLGIE